MQKMSVQLDQDGKRGAKNQLRGEAALKVQKGANQMALKNEPSSSVFHLAWVLVTLTIPDQIDISDKILSHCFRCSEGHSWCGWKNWKNDFRPPPRFGYSSGALGAPPNGVKARGTTGGGIADQGKSLSGQS